MQRRPAITFVRASDASLDEVSAQRCRDVSGGLFEQTATTPKNTHEQRAIYALARTLTWLRLRASASERRRCPLAGTSEHTLTCINLSTFLISLLCFLH